MAKRSNDEKPEDRRRYPRVELSQKKTRAPALLDLRCRWPWGEECEVIDISFQGSAITRPTKNEFRPTEFYDLEFCWNDGSRMQARSRVMWSNDKVVGVHFPSLMPRDRLLLDDFLEEQIKGVNLRPIDTKILASHVDCDLWYQGVAEINVYIWMGDTPQSLERIRIELDLNVVEVAQGKVIVLDRGIESKVTTIFEKDLSKRTEVQGPERKDLVRRAILLISHIPNDKLPLQSVIKDLTQFI